MILPEYGWVNVKGSGDQKSPDGGSWKDYWEARSNGAIWPNTCAVKGCHNQASDGAHVRQQSGSDQYIVPMCDSCNNPYNENTFSLNGTLVKV